MITDQHLDANNDAGFIYRNGLQEMLYRRSWVTEALSDVQSPRPESTNNDGTGRS